MAEMEEHPDWKRFWDDNISVHQEVLWRTLEYETMPLILKYIPKAGKILDAGCGRGGMLIYLSRLGFNMHGCEISKKNISIIKQFDSSIPVDEEDILHMSYDNSRFDAMLSYGVMEHFESGPLQALIEARRVLKPGGILFVSVPYTTKYREYKKGIKKNKFLRVLLGKKPKKEQKNVEVELLFTKAEFSEYLNNSGFEVVEAIPILCKHYVASKSSVFRSKNYPQKPHYGDLLDPDLSKLGKLFYYTLSTFYPWRIGHFQFFVARAV